MTVTAKPLVEAMLVPSAETPAYITPNNTTTIIDKCTVTNTTGTAATITIKVITYGGAASALNTIVSAQSVAAGACYLCPEIVGQILSGGDTLSVMSGTATALTMRVSGREVA